MRPLHLRIAGPIGPRPRRGNPGLALKSQTVPPIHLTEKAPVGDKTTMHLDRKTVSIPRACELVGVSRRTIYNWIAGGKVQYVRTAGGSVRIFEDTLWREGEPAAHSEEAGHLASTA